MKMPSSRQFCGYCRLPVLKHKDSTGLVEGGVIFHKRRCYPKFLKDRKKWRRRIEAAGTMQST